ncbi:MAG TPA: NRDE family protein [Pirellulaceae bacterium]|jgi:uncharacterized protein with NRDE domain|nr:NRDE family protein [Pirellulaceae bacterium]
MSLIAIQYRLVPEAPILVAANREEAYSRASLPPSIQSGKPRVLCGVDQQTRGSWLTVNQHGLFVAAANRPKLDAPIVPRSRGLLVRELARCQTSRQAVDVALDELSSDKYDGVNLIVADSESGWAIHGGDEPEATELRDGLSIIGNRNVNDPRDERVQLAHRLLTLQTLDSPVKFLAMASKVFARAPMHPDRPQMILRGPNRGTVSSTLLALGKKPRDAIYQFAAGSPDETPYEDFSPLLRDILSRGLRESRMKAKA